MISAITAIASPRAKALLLVEHDKEAMFSLADRITVLTGTPDEIRDHPEVVRAYLGEEHDPADLREMQL